MAKEAKKEETTAPATPSVQELIARQLQDLTELNARGGIAALSATYINSQGQALGGWTTGPDAPLLLLLGGCDFTQAQMRAMLRG